MSTQPMMFPSEWSERMAYERVKAGYWPYDIEDLRHFCALRDLRIEELKADNAKLRELCKKLYRLADESYVPFKDVNPWMNEFDNAIRAMRELGVDV